MKLKNFVKKNKAFCLFAVLAILIILAAVFAPVVTGGISPTDAVLKDALQAPSPNHIFGTDKLGRDIFARVIYGARTSLVASFSVVLIIFVLGTVLGVLAGYFGGWADTVIMRLADMMVSFPGMVFAMAIA
ncbi:MAG: ABC transporter permease, partial [Faecousia sp.]